MEPIHSRVILGQIISDLASFTRGDDLFTRLIKYQKYFIISGFIR